MKTLKTLLVAITVVMACTLNLNAKEKKSSKTSEVTYNIALNCADCVKKAEAKIPNIKGVKDLEVSLKEQSACITYDNTKTDEATLKSELKKIGYDVTVKKGSDNKECNGDCDHDHDKGEGCKDGNNCKDNNECCNKEKSESKKGCC